MSQAPQVDALSTYPVTRRRRAFTGHDMAMILVIGFGVVIAVNVLMASLASSTFGGIVVENSYVASQKFNHWLDEAAQGKALGWKVAALRRGDGRVEAQLAGAPDSATLVAVARHPLGRLPDMTLTFRRSARGTYESDRALPVGRWLLRFDVKADGRRFRTEVPVS